MSRPEGMREPNRGNLGLIHVFFTFFVCLPEKLATVFSMGQS